MDEDEVTKAVLAYLKKKGMTATELAFQAELQCRNSSSSASKTDPDIAKQILSFSESENGPTRYQDGYSKLRSWTYSSLDSYKHELLRVLYPVFIHCFMDLVAKGYSQEARTFFNSFREDHELLHLWDLQKLEGVLCPSHLEEMEFAHSLTQSKVNIEICQFSYELLLQYLHKTQSITMLGIINEHINFQVSPGQPSSISDDADTVVYTHAGLSKWLLESVDKSIYSEKNRKENEENVNKIRENLMKELHARGVIGHNKWDWDMIVSAYGAIDQYSRRLPASDGLEELGENMDYLINKVNFLHDEANKIMKKKEKLEKDLEICRIAFKEICESIEKSIGGSGSRGY